MQEADANGRVSFSIFPAGGGGQRGNKVATSQIALPKSALRPGLCHGGLSDGSELELATVTGSTAAGFTAALTVPVGSRSLLLA